MVPSLYARSHKKMLKECYVARNENAKQQNMEKKKEKRRPKNREREYIVIL